MTTTLREPATTAPSLLTADQDADNPENGCGLAERRASGGNLTCRGTVLARRSTTNWYAEELLGWSAALETRHVSFDNWQREQGAAA